ncbi:mitochondrial ribosomal protein MRP51, partial [Amanita rubescens]
MSSAVVAAVAKPIAPPSPFAELLRRSRFATYDPAIRQIYSSPAAHAHRGDWGIKRPLSLRKRNTFISFTSFEHRAHFTDWNHAQNEVRFIRRVEEMGVKISLSEQSSWHEGLGDVKTHWPLDSEFCPGEGSINVVHNEKWSKIPVSLDPVKLGNRGPGQYGSNRPHENLKPQQPILNHSAMTEKQFKRYLRKLRALQPEFREYLKSQTDKSVYELTQDGVHPHHLRFLSHRTAQEYRDPNTRKIKDQPHPNAALMYARTTQFSSSL